MMRATFIVAISLALIAGGSTGFLTGEFSQYGKDKREALHKRAGYYEQTTGTFTFGPPPVELLNPSISETGRALPMLPVRKPKH